MLEKLPSAVGRALDNVRPGMKSTVFFQDVIIDAPETITVTSAAFKDGMPIPVSYTQDGDRLSPPLAWTGIPNGTRSVALLIEDADSPTPHPLVHTIAWNLPPDDYELAAGALRATKTEGGKLDLGKNSFFCAEYLPPDPPPGHGPHRYVFQIFALDRQLTLKEKPGRHEVVEAMKGHVLAKGCILGTYQRE